MASFVTPLKTFVFELRGFCMPKEMRQCWKSVVGAPPGKVTVSSSHKHPRYLFFLTRWAMACYRPMLLVLYWGSGCGGGPARRWVRGNERCGGGCPSRSAARL